MRAFLLSSVIALSGVSLTDCAAIPHSAPQTVYALESEYAAALAVGAAYNELPRCPSTRDSLCSDPDKVTALRKSVVAADSALHLVEVAARAHGDTVSALLVASAAVESLTLLTHTLQTK